MWSFSLNSAARLLILTTIAVLTGYYVVFGGEEYFSVSCLGLSIGILSVLFWASGSFSKRFPLSWMLTFVIFFFIGLRLVALAYRPDWLLGYGRVTPDIFSSLLFFILIGTVLSFLGVGFGQVLGQATGLKRQNLRPPLSYEHCAAIALCFAMVHIIEFLLVGYHGATGSGSHLNIFSRYILPFLSMDIAYFILFVSYFLLSSPTQKQKKTFISLVLLNIAFVTLKGSRSALLEILILFLASMILFRPTIKIKMNSIRFLVVFSLVVLSPFIFHAATYIRENTWYIRSLYFSSLDYNLLEAISYRVSLIESTMNPMFYKELGLYDVSDLVNLKTTIYSTINRLVPGKPFEGIVLNEHAFGFLYNPEGNVRLATFDQKHYVGYEWGLFGISFQLFGYFGGLLFVFLFTSALSFFVAVLKRRGTFCSYCIAFVLTYAMFMWAKNLGLDNFFDRIGHYLILMGLYLVTAQVLLHRRGTVSRAASIVPAS